MTSQVLVNNPNIKAMQDQVAASTRMLADMPGIKAIQDQVAASNRMLTDMPGLKAVQDQVAAATQMFVRTPGIKSIQDQVAVASKMMASPASKAIQEQVAASNRVWSKMPELKAIQDQVEANTRVWSDFIASLIDQGGFAPDAATNESAGDGPPNLDATGVALAAALSMCTTTLLAMVAAARLAEGAQWVLAEAFETLFLIAGTFGVLDRESDAFHGLVVAASIIGAVLPIISLFSHPGDSDDDSKPS